MATWTSYFPSGLSDKLYLAVVVNQSSQSVTNNRSVLSWSAYVVQNAPTASWCHYGDATAKITINGTTVFSGKWNGTGNWDFRGQAAQATQPVASGTITVPHNSDGTKKVTITGTATDTAFPLGTASIGTQSMTLTTIPRASSFTVTPATVPLDGTKKVTVNISRASSSFTHEVYWGSGSFEFKATGVATSATSPIIPKSWAGNLPNHTSSTMYVTVVTKSGSTEVGRSTKRIPITVPDTAEFRPTITTRNRRLQSEKLPPGSTVTLQGYTGWEFAVESAAGAYNSSIVNFEIYGPGGWKAGKWSGSTEGSRTLQVAPARLTGNQIYQLSVTDTRGRTTTVDVPVTVTPYQKPGVNRATAGRALSNGDLSDTGTFIKVGGLVGLTQFTGNTVQTTAAYRALGETAWQGETVVSSSAGAVTAVIGSNDIRIDTSWEVRIRVTDLLTSSEVILSVPPAKYLQSIDTVNGSVAFGGPAAETSEFRVYESMPAHFDGALFHRGQDVSILYGTGPSIYNPTAGVLVTTSIKSDQSRLFKLDVQVHTYLLGPPGTASLQGYAYAGGTILRTGGTTNMPSFPVHVFYVDDRLCFWWGFQSSYRTYTMNLTVSPVAGGNENIVSVTDSGLPASRVGERLINCDTTSGVWPRETLSSPNFSSAPVYAWTLLKPAPYVPPVGWTFAVHLVGASGYSFVSSNGYADGVVFIRVLNIANAAPTIQLGWQLVRDS